MARLVKSLVKLRAQVNEAAPNRDKSSDGWIGDSAHSSRPSDHNPESDGTVDALDIDHDPAHGSDVDRIFEAVIESRDPRLKYLIRKGRILSGRLGPSPWRWRDRGKDPNQDHFLHGHISVLDEAQDDESPWSIAMEEDDMFEKSDRDLLKGVVDATRVGGESLKAKGLDVYVKERFDDLEGRIENIESAVATLQTGGVDAEVLAEAVASKLAKRLEK